MTTNKLCLLALVVFQIIVSKCQIMEQSTCDVSDTAEIESCLKHREFNELKTENEPDALLYKDTEQMHQSWLSSMYYSAATAIKDLIDKLFPGFSEHRGAKGATYKEDIDIPTDYVSPESVKALLNDVFGIDSSKDKLLNDIFNEAFKKDEETVEVVDKGEYEYPPVYRHNPGKVGDYRYIELEDGVKSKLITRAVRPPLFEIPNFLSDEECDYMIEKTREKGLNVSTLFQSKANTDAGINVGVHRKSFSSSLKIQDTGESFMSRLHDRVSSLIGMPKQVVQWSENLAMGMYEPGGHYHAHLDSNEESRHVPCCFQTNCSDNEDKEVENKDCCRLCRYVTVLYYLNNVEEGGETAFPFADLSFQGMMKIRNGLHWQNLTSHCHDSTVVIKPEKGKAIMWYNHFVDGKGYISAVDKRSYHGGCEVIKGTKWIATNWISTPIYSQRFKPSKHRDFI